MGSTSTNTLTAASKKDMEAVMEAAREKIIFDLTKAVANILSKKNSHDYLTCNCVASYRVVFVLTCQVLFAFVEVLSFCRQMLMVRAVSVRKARDSIRVYRGGLMIKRYEETSINRPV